MENNDNDNVLIRSFKLRWICGEEGRNKRMHELK